MAEFNLKNYSVLYTDANFFETATEIANANLADLKTIGVVKSESGFKIEPDQTVKDSNANDVVYSHKLTLNVDVLSALSETQLDAIDNKLLSIIAVPKSVKIPDGVTDLSNADVVIPATAKALLFAPATIKVIEEEKWGTGEIDPINLSAEATGETKSLLKKTIPFNITEQA